MLSDYTRLARPFFVMLGIVTVGRWLQGTAFGVPYDKGTHVFSIVTLCLFASVFSAVFTRSWLGWRLPTAAGFAMFMAVVAQVVILLSTVVSYAFGIPSYFSHPTALNQPEAVGLSQALLIRAGGLVVNTLLNGIAGSLGWALGGLLPPRPGR
jgi:hypothetical protein